MNILMYVVSKAYRNKIKLEYNKDFSSKLEQEEIQKEFIYKQTLEGNLN